jgi:hypothetical protein
MIANRLFKNDFDVIAALHASGIARYRARVES